ncbi:MAG: carboxypeptidase-like regulatory domain-containing protein [Bacteroidota bacterium]
MLLSRVNILFSLLTLYSSILYSQQDILEKRVNISFEGQSVKEALKKLMEEHDCTITYQPSSLPEGRKVTLSFTQTPIKTVIQKVWGNGQLKFRSRGNEITFRLANKNENNSENGFIQGRIINADNEPVAFATIAIDGTTQGVTADGEGKFKIPLAVGPSALIISSSGYKMKEVDIKVESGENKKLTIRLSEAVSALEEVVVFGKSQEQLKMEEPIKVEVINTKKLQTKSLSLPQVINQIPGVKIRQAGGVGSETIININGLQGNAIRFFRDGIPLDYLGRAFALNLVPVDQLDNIEIYKGVLPAELGADALGGAMNLTSRKDFSNNLDLAYTIGSFNTHQINVNGYLDIPNSKLFVSLASYYLYSDNNYKVIVPIADEETANLVDTEVERFHDGIETYFAETKVGLRNFKYGDLLVFGYSHFDLEKERQNGLQLDPNSALGEVMDYETSNIFSLRYRLNKGKFSTDIFGSYSDQNTLFVDDPESRWNWLGERIPLRNQGGESSPFSRYYRDINFTTWTARINAGYKLSEKHQLVFNHNLISRDRIGSDTLEIIFGTDIDPFTFPTNYTRHISGLGLTSSLWKNKIQNVLTVKQFYLNTSTTVAGLLNDGDRIVVTKTTHGIGNSTKFSLNKNRFLRFSYEYATRIPESIEYLGDALFILANPNLTPETSHNINTGIFTNLGKKEKHWLDLNVFYRFVQNNIILFQSGFSNGIFRNANDSRVVGSELSLKGQIIPGLRYNFSVTYQDLRRVNASGTNLSNSRLPNRPYFFSNTGLRYTLPKVFIKGNWDGYLNYGFVEQYLLGSVPRELEPGLFEREYKFDSKTIIDAQHTLDIGMTYKYSDMPLWVSLEVNNLLDIPVFDGFRVQLPGRNFRIKLKYTIEGKSNEKIN